MHTKFSNFIWDALGICEKDENRSKSTKVTKVISVVEMHSVCSHSKLRCYPTHSAVVAKCT